MSALIEAMRDPRYVVRSLLVPLVAVLAGCASNYGAPINGEQALSPEERRLQAVETKVADLSRRLTATDAGREQKSSQELGVLRGLLEQQRYDFDQSQRRQQEQFLALDTRLKALEAGAQPPAPIDGSGVAPDGSVPSVPPVNGLPGSATPISSAADEEALYLKSFDLLKAAKYDDAIRGFRGMLDKYPQGNYSDNAWYWTGESYYIKKDYTNALASYRSLLEKFAASPKVPDALLKTGIIQQDQKRVDQARAAFSRVIQEFPNSSAAIQARTRLAQLK